MSQTKLTYLYYLIVYFVLYFILDAVSCENEVNDIIMSEQDLISEVITSEQLLSDPTLVLPPYLNPSLEYYQLVSLGTSSQSW